VDEGDAGLKGRLVVEINAGGVEDVEDDGSALGSGRELCGGTGNGRGGSYGRVCVVCKLGKAGGGDARGEGGGIEEETGEGGLSGPGTPDDEEIEGGDVVVGGRGAMGGMGGMGEMGERGGGGERGRVLAVCVGVVEMYWVSGASGRVVVTMELLLGRQLGHGSV
jgi:hypothetical protein